MNAVTVISQALKAVYRGLPIGIDTELIGINGLDENPNPRGSGWRLDTDWNRLVPLLNELVAGSDETNDTVCVMTSIGMPGDGPPPHIHTREDETFIIHEGVLDICQDDQTVTCHSGDMIFLPRGRRHYFRIIIGFRWPSL
jgi:mannose-6-phosphate isomerase-like protein (cupin superfamily)